MGAAQVPLNQVPLNQDGLDTATRLRELYRRTYRLRTLGMGLGSLPVAMVLSERGAGGVAWAWALFCGLIWPHLAYQLSKRSASPYHTEVRNFLIDSALAASLVPLIHFNVLPSAVLLSVTTADKLNTGVRDLWRRSLLPMLAALVASILCNGAQTAFPTSQFVLLACLPLMVIHTLAVSASSHRLVRQVQKQNRMLDQLTRFDSLTGLGSRAHWQSMAETLLHRHHQGQPATLLLVDVDGFKQTNDQHGHTTGDDLLREIAGCITASLPAESHAGRLGGDEFAIALPLALADAEHIAQSIGQRVRSLQFPQTPALRGSVSIGLSQPPAADASLRSWLEAADRALYLAKSAGRDCYRSGPLPHIPT